MAGPFCAGMTGPYCALTATATSAIKIVPAIALILIALSPYKRLGLLFPCSSVLPPPRAYHRSEPSHSPAIGTHRIALLSCFFLLSGAIQRTAQGRLWQ